MVILANLLSVYAFTNEINAYYQQREIQLSDNYTKIQESQRQMGLDNYYDNSATQESRQYYAQANNLRNERNTVVSLAWAIYAIMLVIAGFAKKIRLARLMGIIFFFVTGLKVFMNVWSLGTGYRVVSFITFGIIALAASFLYSKYQSQIRQII